MIETESTTNWFTDRTLPLWKEHIVPYFAGKPVDLYVEVGVYEGVSLLWIVENLLAGRGMAVGIDHWIAHRRMSRLRDRAEEAKATAFRNLGKWMYSNTPLTVELFESGSCEGLLKLLGVSGCLVEPEHHWRGTVWKESTDLVFIDGGHDADVALSDMILSWHLLRPGGVMVVDDIHIDASRRRPAGKPRVAEALAAFLSCFNPKELYRTVHQIALIK